MLYLPYSTERCSGGAVLQETKPEKPLSSKLMISLYDRSSVSSPLTQARPGARGPLPQSESPSPRLLELIASEIKMVRLKSGQNKSSGVSICCYHKIQTT
nr:unnamed protein product [Callosobruchus chinensis]